MVKFLILINFLFLLISCKSEKPISYGTYKAVICKDNKNNLKKYIFNKNNGYLYFYMPKKDEFIPLNLRLESGFFTEDIPEIVSYIKKNKLEITTIEYNDSKEDYLKYKSTINLRNMIKKTIYKNNKDQIVQFIVKCNWIDPKS